MLNDAASVPLTTILWPTVTTVTAVPGAAGLVKAVPYAGTVGSVAAFAPVATGTERLVAPAVKAKVGAAIASIESSRRAVKAVVNIFLFICILFFFS